MKYLLKTILGCFILLAIFSCIDDKDTELEQPKFELISPIPCDTLFFGADFHLKANISDNSGLGNMSMDIHDNFGHHNHGAHESCAMDEAKEAINPYISNWMFSLPDSSKEFILDTLLQIPLLSVENLSYDTGDYHFHIYISDNEGYQIFTSMDVKLLYK